MTALKQIDFAELLGVARSYVTKLKADGRLVMTPEGLVDVEQSRDRISATADLNRDDVASRWAAQRDRAEAPAPDEPDAVKAPEVDTPAAGTFAAARARKETAQAEIAEMERDKIRGLLIERPAIEAAIEDVMTTVRQALEQQPHRVAPMLVGHDLDQIRATLKQENHSILSEMVRDFGKRIRQIAGEEE